MAAATNTNPGLIASLKTPATPPAAGFTNMIQMLLGPNRAPVNQNPAAPATDYDASANNTSANNTSSNDTSSANSLAAPVPVPANQLADAMIRSMLGAAGNLTGTAAAARVFTPADPAPIKKTPARATQDLHPATPSQPASLVASSSFIPPAVMALTQSPLMRSADTAGKAALAKLPFGAVVIPVTARTTAAPAPLAFGMKLTPVTDPQSSPAPAVSAAQAEPSVTPAQAPIETQPEPVAPEAEPEPSKPAASSSVPADTKIQKDAASHSDAAPVVTAVSGAAASTDDFARQLPQMFSTANVSMPSGKIASPAVPVTSQPTRAEEPAAPAAPQPATTPLKEITVRIATPQTPAVDVHVAERAGQIHVAVRTADGGLQTSLRQDLGTLVNSLERSGYRAEAITSGGGSPALAAQTNSQNSRQESESGSGGRNGNFGDPSQNSGGGQQQQRRNPRPSNWIEELENQQ